MAFSVFLCRSLGREAAGVAVGLAHEGANRPDARLLASRLDSLPIERPEPTRKRPQRLCLDRGDDDERVRELVCERGDTAHIRTRGAAVRLTLRTPRVARPPLGRRGLPLLAEPQPGAPDPLV